MTEKGTYIIRVYDSDNPAIQGWGEVALFRGLSADDTPDFENLLDYWCCNLPCNTKEIPSSAIRFGLETAFSDLANGGTMRPFCISDDISVKINGLVWMGDKDFMVSEARKKLQQGFKCLKFKIGGIEFADELEILRSIRQKFPNDVLEIRLDANGAFSAADALAKIEALNRYGIHSIEQPIQPGQPDDMRRICLESSIPIALDEELIGINSTEAKRQMLAYIHPQYIILKPSLCGGFREADEWISVAGENGIGWWATSALESDIGLNAILRWVAAKSPNLPQGLGTGQVYSNNFTSPLYLSGDRLSVNPSASWDLTSAHF